MIETGRYAVTFTDLIELLGPPAVEIDFNHDLGS
jgi:hypothetical protein